MSFWQGILSSWKNTDNKPYFGITDPGRQREKNEDTFLLLPELEIYAVADGIGGHVAGGMASNLAAKALRNFFENGDLDSPGVHPDQEIVKGINWAHEEILRVAKSRQELVNMGSTIVLAMIQNRVLITCHVGDSRAYVLNSTGIQAVTGDHSDVANLVRAGKLKPEDARKHPLKHKITQALGAPFQIQPELNRFPLKPKDKVLLCSDGLWEMLSDQEIYDIVINFSNLAKAGQVLIDRANNAGGEDNITAVLIDVP